MMMMSKGSWFRKMEAPWLYVLTSPMGFDVADLQIPNMHVYSLKGRLIGLVEEGMLVLHKGYAWDGCTGVGRIIETEGTLRASVLHDFLYQLAEQPDFKLSYTQRQADLRFLHYLPLWAKPLWFTGVRLFGWAFFGDTTKSLNINYTQLL